MGRNAVFAATTRAQSLLVAGLCCSRSPVSFAKASRVRSDHTERERAIKYSNALELVSFSSTGALWPGPERADRQDAGSERAVPAGMPWPEAPETSQTHESTAAIILPRGRRRRRDDENRGSTRTPDVGTFRPASSRRQDVDLGSSDADGARSAAGRRIVVTSRQEIRNQSFVSTSIQRASRRRRKTSKKQGRSPRHIERKNLTLDLSPPAW